MLSAEQKVEELDEDFHLFNEVSACSLASVGIWEAPQESDLEPISHNTRRSSTVYNFHQPHQASD